MVYTKVIQSYTQAIHRYTQAIHVKIHTHSYTKVYTKPYISYNTQVYTMYTQVTQKTKPTQKIWLVLRKVELKVQKTVINLLFLI